MTGKGDDLYGLLQVARTATADELKKAWRRIALREHPDKGGDKERFQRIQAAYAVLSDPDSRKLYDLTGQSNDRLSAEQKQNLLRRRFAALQRLRTALPSGKGSPLSHTVHVPLSVLWAGHVYRFTITRQLRCVDCSGRGFCVNARTRCLSCAAGAGRDACTMCKGTGWPRCITCAGKGIATTGVPLVVPVERGQSVPTIRTFPGLSSQPAHCAEPGDVILFLQPAPNDPANAAGWKRVGSDMHRTLYVTPEEVANSWRRRFVGHPSGKEARLCWTGGRLSPRECLRLLGWGMPYTDASSGELRFGDCILIAQTITAETVLTEADQAELMSGEGVSADDADVVQPRRFFDRQ